MANFFSLLLCIFLLVTAHAQRSHELEKVLIRLAVEGEPNMAYRFLTSNGDGISNQIKDFLDQNEVSIIGGYAGLAGLFQFNNWIEISIGLNYSRLGYQTRKMEFLGSGTGSNSISDVQTHFRVSDQYDYVGIPLSFSFLIGKKRVRMIAGVGVTPNFLFSGNRIMKNYYLDGSIKQNNSNLLDNNTSNLRRFNVMAFANVGVEIDVSTRIAVRISPSFSYGVVKLTDSPVSGFLWSAGVRFGLLLNLAK